MPSDATTATARRPRAVGPKSDPRSIPHGKAYNLALRFNAKQRGIAAFEWVAVWRTFGGQSTRAFPLVAHGFAEALRGAATLILLETGLPVPPVELEIASYKERRVNEYLRSLALAEAAQAAPAAPKAPETNPIAEGPDTAWPFRTALTAERGFHKPRCTAAAFG